MIRILALLILVLLPLGSMASDELSFDVSSDVIRITTGFVGDEIALFGTKGQEADVIITVSGPKRDLIVREKQRILGFWINASSLKFKDIPCYYDIFATKELVEILDVETLIEKGIGVDGITFASTSGDSKRKSKFLAALLTKRQSEGLYPDVVRPVSLIKDDFYRVNLLFPAQIPKGDYEITVYLVKEREIIDQRSKIIHAEQEGLAANVVSYAEKKPILYGFIGVLMAVFLGWGATEVLRRD